MCNSLITKMFNNWYHMLKVHLAKYGAMASGIGKPVINFEICA